MSLRILTFKKMLKVLMTLAFMPLGPAYYGRSRGEIIHVFRPFRANHTITVIHGAAPHVWIFRPRRGFHF